MGVFFLADKSNLDKIYCSLSSRSLCLTIATSQPRLHTPNAKMADFYVLMWVLGPQLLEATIISAKLNSSFKENKWRNFYFGEIFLDRTFP